MFSLKLIEVYLEFSHKKHVFNEPKILSSLSYRFLCQSTGFSFSNFHLDTAQRKFMSVTIHTFI